MELLARPFLKRDYWNVNSSLHLMLIGGAVVVVARCFENARW